MTQSETTSAAGGGEPLSLSRIKDAISYHAHGCEDGYAKVSVHRLLEWRHGLSATLAAPTAKGGTEVPAGWKLVPVHPTMAMIGAGRRWEEGTTSAWSAMLAASPPPPAGAAGGGSGDLAALSEGATAVIGCSDWGSHDIRPNPHGAGRWCARCGVLETTCSLEGNPCRPLYAGAKPYGGRAPTPDLGAQGEGTREIAVSRNGPRCQMCGSSWSYDGAREDDPLFCAVCDSDPDLEDQRTSDLDTQGEPLGDQPTHPTDPFLKVVVTIQRDDTTTCSLSFVRGAKFPLARAAVRKAIAALQAEITDSDKCPASVASTHDLGARGGLSDWVEEQIEELSRLGREASDREASANAEGRQTDADFCAGESHAYHEAAGVLMEAIERVSFAPDLDTQGEPVAIHAANSLVTNARTVRVGAAPAAAPAPPVEGKETIRATQIMLGEGLVDIGPITHEGRVGVLFRPRAEHIPFGQAGELQECAYWPGPNDVVLWVSGEGPQVAIDALAAIAPAAPRTGSGVSVEEIADLKDRIRLKASEPSLQQFQDALGANLTEAGYLLGFKLKSTGTTSMWVRLSSGREIIVDESEWAPATAVQAPRDGGETQGGWQPIETAPKDGTKVQGYGPHDKDGWYIDTIHCWEGRWTIQYMHGFGAPTHWRPLPTPPSGVETTRQDNTSGGL